MTSPWPLRVPNRYPVMPCTGPYGVMQKHNWPGYMGWVIQHQNWGVKQIVPG
jgi:hypothetical protein